MQGEFSFNLKYDCMWCTRSGPGFFHLHYEVFITTTIIIISISIIIIIIIILIYFIFRIVKQYKIVLI